MERPVIKWLFFLSIPLPFAIINFSGFSKGDEPLNYQVIGSIIFMVIWSGFSYYFGSKQDRSFLKHALIFWGISGLMLGYSYMFSFSVIHLIFIFLYPGPMYGTNYFLQLPTDLIFVMASYVIIIATSLLSYFLGRILKQGKN